MDLETVTGSQETLAKHFRLRLLHSVETDRDLMPFIAGFFRHTIYDGLDAIDIEPGHAALRVSHPAHFSAARLPMSMPTSLSTR